MGDYTEADAAHVRGWIDGYLEGAAEYCDQETEFLETRWQELAGSRVIYSSIPAWPSEEARRRRDPPVVLCDWDANSETRFLKLDARLPGDRSGCMVFPKGTTVVRTDGAPVMFEIRDQDVAKIERVASLQLEMIRDAYGFQTG